MTCLAPSMDYAGRLYHVVSTMDFDYFTSCATGPTVLPAAKRKWQGAEKTGSEMLHGLQGLLPRSAH